MTLSYTLLNPRQLRANFLNCASKKRKAMHFLYGGVGFADNCEITGAQVFPLQKPFYVVRIYSYLLRGSPSLVNGVRMIAYCASLRCSDVVS
jgi:hypothetical protein